MSARKTIFALTLLLGGGIGSLFASSTPAEAQRTLAATATATGSGTLQELTGALSRGAPVTPSGRPSGCNGPNPGCGPTETGGGSKGGILKGFLMHAAASCFIGVASNGEAQLTLVGGLVLNTLAAEGCFKLMEEVKKASVVSGLNSLEIYCSREHGKPGLKEQDTDYFGIKSSVTVQGEVLAADFERIQKDAAKHGFKITEAEHSDDVTAGFKKINIEIGVKTDAIFTPDEIKYVEKELVAEMRQNGIDMVPDKKSSMKTVYSFTDTSGAVFGDDRKIGSTRALAVKDSYDAAFEFSKKLSSVVDGVLSRAEERFGKVCVAFDPNSGKRYSLRTSAQGKGNGYCLGKIAVGGGKVLSVMGRYIPDLSKALGRQPGQRL